MTVYFRILDSEPRRCNVAGTTAVMAAVRQWSEYVVVPQGYEQLLRDGHQAQLESAVLSAARKLAALEEQRTKVGTERGSVGLSLAPWAGAPWR